MSVEKTQQIMEKYFSGHNPEVLGDDTVFTLMADGSETVGRDAINQMLQYFYQTAFDGKYEETNTVFGDGHAFTEGYLVGKHIGEFAGIPATHKDVRVPMCVSYDVGDTQIKRARIYFLMSPLMHQLCVG